MTEYFDLGDAGFLSGKNPCSHIGRLTENAPPDERWWVDKR
jgi:hypothetical protein